MIKLIIFLAAFVAQQVYCDEPERIVGGDIATAGQFKYQVSLQSYDEHICGGSIISNTHILTAAHCVDDDFYTENMLKNPIEVNDVQGPISLASIDHVSGDKRGIVSGWGKTKISGPTSIMLRWLSVNVLSQERCLRGHKNPRTNENQICTLEKVGKGACQGDSGGPLVVDNELVGVVSWVLPCALGISDVYTNVYRYVDFIKESQSMC
ncbi:hypothetical protein PUN28_019243 [Cardiocondyla obscurior]|uniref:Peptidase S1 domain-containing protein n=1 Tax=Cardiocondyla obscurior TaxID=286306 RepID=A0AAW2EAK8_9HYME